MYPPQSGEFLRAARMALAALALATGATFAAPPAATTTATTAKTPPKPALGGLQPSKVESRVLTAEDGWPIHITYFASPAESEAAAKETPVVILLHGNRENRLTWEGKAGLALRLQRDGYAVITVDLRKHGQSQDASRSRGNDVDGANLQPTDVSNMLFDLIAVKEFIYGEHQAKRLNMNKTGIVASEWAGVVALNFASRDWSLEPYTDGPTYETRTPRGQDIRTCVLISPTQRFKNLNVSQSLTDLRGGDCDLSVLILFGKLSKADAKEGETMFRKLTQGARKDADRFQALSFNYNLRGTNLLGKKEIDAETHIVKFLNDRLRAVKSEWRDRRNRLTGK